VDMVYRLLPVNATERRRHRRQLNSVAQNGPRGIVP
jgi:hypothetical protein